MTRFDRRPQLIAYPDALGGTIATLHEVLTTEMAGWFPGGVHLLPPFPSTGDRGFAPTRYDEVDPRFGSWADLEALAAAVPVTLDVMVNHISRRSPEFTDLVRHGLDSPHADLFMRPDKVWPDGQVPDEHVRALFLRRPGDPFLEVPVADGSTVVVWATFGTSSTASEQIDLDWRSPLTRATYDRWFSTLAAAGVAELRLDAVGYLCKEAGTSCFMVEPCIWEAIDLLTELADRHDLAVLPEVHAEPPVIEAFDRRARPTYDFVLPGLVLHALLTGRSDVLARHLASLPSTRVTTLDCHDGVPIQPDLVGVLPVADLRALVDGLVARGANVNRILGAEERGIDFDAHQVNIAELDAAGGPEGLAVARAVQLFAPGRPQVYYLGLFGGANDHDAVRATGEGRAVNRTSFDLADVRAAVASPVTRRQARLLELRSRHPAFAADHPEVSATGPTGLAIRWTHGEDWCRLAVDLASPAAEVTMSPHPGLTPGPV